MSKKYDLSLVFINYNRKFMEGYSKKVLPLTNLTIEKNLWQWEEKEKAAFQNLKAACCTQPVLKIFDPEKPIQIETDASDLAIGACLSQEYDKNWHPIVYLSRKLSAAKQNYDVHDKELLAIVVSLETWRVYAKEAPQLTILTDHKNLL